MKEKFLDQSMDFIRKNQDDLTDEDQEKLAYGLEGLYLTFTKLAVINVLALILGIWKEFFISLILFNILRFPGFGFHANNSITCLLSSSLLMLGMPYLMTHITLNIYGKIFICTICIICFFLYAPADTEKRPLTNKRKRRIRKIAACILVIIYSVLIIVFQNTQLSSLLLSGMIIETVLILPITYRLYKAPYRNYLKI